MIIFLCVGISSLEFPTWKLDSLLFQILDPSEFSISVLQNRHRENLGKRIGSNRQKDWQKVSYVFYVNPDDEFYIEFGFKCGGYKGDLGLDDILITGCDKPVESPDDTEGRHFPKLHDSIPAKSSSEMEEAANCYGGIASALTCNFDNQNDRCGWKRVNFRRWQHQTYTPDTGPVSAHSGYYYLYLEASDDSVATLESIPMSPGQSICLRFSYHMVGVDSGTISVVADNKVVWKATGSQGDEWQIAQVSIFTKNRQPIQIVATSDGLFSDIAIDSIIVSECHCDLHQSIQSDTGLSCMFEFGTVCSYQAFNNIKLADGVIIEPSGRLQSNRFHAEQDGCMTITYKSHSVGQRMVAELMRAKSNGITEIWSSTLTSSSGWTQHTFPIPQGKNQVLQIKTEILNNGQNTNGFQIKSLMYDDGPCKKQFDCNFENRNSCELKFGSHTKKATTEIYSDVKFHGRETVAINLNYGETLQGTSVYSTGCISLWHTARGKVLVKGVDSSFQSKPSLSRWWQFESIQVGEGPVVITTDDYTQIASIKLTPGNPF